MKCKYNGTIKLKFSVILLIIVHYDDQLLKTESGITHNTILAQ